MELLKRLLHLILTFLFLLIPYGDGLMGYDVSAQVNDSTLEIHRTIQDMKFDSAGLINGFGNFSKYSNIYGFAGIKAHELTSSPLPGRIGYADQIKLRSGGGPVLITAQLLSDVIYTGDDSNLNESQKIAISEYGKIDIDEKWMAYFGNQKKILYSGPGIRITEMYENNGDYVKTSIDSWELSKESLYRTAINRTLISANLTTEGVYMDKYSNKSTLFLLSQASVGSKTHIDLRRTAHMEEHENRIVEDYIGQQNITMSLNMGDWIMKLDDDKEWLDCCRVDHDN